MTIMSSFLRLALPMMMAGSLFSQSVGVPGAPYRDKAKEEEVVSMFRAIRGELGGKQLSWIKRRHEIQQLTCTAALIDRTMHSPRTLIYKTTNIADINSELRQLATQDKDGSSGIRRFSVAVWRKRPQSAAPEEYWVGVGLYRSAGGEWFESHLTDEGSYSKRWKTLVVHECRTQ